MAAAALALPLSAESGRAMSHFSWGADIGGSIDMSGHDMSTLNIDAYCGWRGGVFPIVGIGAGLNIPVNNARHEFPVYAIARTSFSSRPQPVFMELRGGLVVNTRQSGESSVDPYISPGVGFRLASGRAFTSYLTVGYIYNGLRSGNGMPSDGDANDDLSNRFRGIHSAVVRLGISF